jgi:tryptophan synthase alpha chain
VRPAIEAPIVVFSYANPVLRMGQDTFVARAQAAGVDGVLTLDLPPEEAGEMRTALRAAGIDTIFLLSPTTSDERIRRAASLGGGFLYGISRLGVTGVRTEVADSAGTLAARVRALTSMPLALGFGAVAEAAVVGSALVQIIADHGQSPDLVQEVERYVRWLRN